MKIDMLDALGPLDGRYRKKVRALAPIFGERGLIERRVWVEGNYLLHLSDHPKIPELREFTADERHFVHSLPRRACREAAFVKRLEEGTKRGKDKKKGTNHDVGAMVLWVQQALSKTSLADVAEWAHLLLTSEDVNNIAYALQLREGIEQVLVPALEAIVSELERLAVSYAEINMLARTHGQPASPTALGKEFRVFSTRLRRELRELKRQTILVKLNGATGNYNAHVAAFPGVDWIAFTRSFVRECNRGRHSVRLAPNFVTTQVESHDTYAELFDRVKRLNTILIDFCQDIWRYISDDWLAQKVIEGEHGSSTMPGKVNPLDFENAEGNLMWGNGMCELFSRVLPISRLQRHLSDSTIIRNFGVAFGHSLLAYKSIKAGLGKIAPDRLKIKRDLNRAVTVITEGIQIILRRENVADAYEQLRQFSRGRKLTLRDVRGFLRKLRVKPWVKRELLGLRPGNYTGLATHLALCGGDLS